MQLPDLINGLFEAGTGLLGWTNVRALVRDKQVKGVNWWFQIFVTLWGLYNLYYYPHLDQWFSFAGGLGIFGANAAWIGLFFYYRYFYERGRT